MSTEADMDSKLIELVEQFPGLYDRGSADHKNPESVATIWEIISRKLKMPSSECQGRWKYLRKRFTQTLGPNWQHYNSLMFLEPFIKRRKLLTSNSSDLKDDEVIIVEECEDEKIDIPVPRKKKRTMCREEDEATSPVHSFRQKNPEEDSVHSFCNSICSDLLKLSSQQMLNCRIDILTVIQKYMLQTNDVNTSNINNSSNAETLVPELMKHFVEVENKVKLQQMKSNDSDWVFLYTIKNFFSKMMELRKDNDELKNLLKNFQFVEQTNAGNGLAHCETNSLPTTTTQCPTNSHSVSICDGLVEPEVRVIKQEVSSSETKSTVVEEPVYIEETKLTEVIPLEVATLKENILFDGMTNDNFCNICNMKTTNADSHRKNQTHVTARKGYFFNFCIQDVNPLIFDIKNDRLQCSFCFQNIFSLFYLKKHNLSNKHVQYTKSIVEKADSRCCNYIARGVLKIGTSFRFCLLCQEHIFAMPHYGNQHKRMVMEVESFCKVKNDVYCFICKKSFALIEFDNHRNEQTHKTNFRIYYAKVKNFYDS